MKDILVREAKIEEADELGSLHLRTWEESYRSILRNEFPEAITAISRSEMRQRVLSQPETFGLVSVAVAQAPEGIVGFASCSTQRDVKLRELGYAGEIGAIYVLNAFQGKGIGRALMYEMANALSERKHNSVSLWVLEKNLKARRIYENLGATPINLSKPFQTGSSILEVAYGWRDLSNFECNAIA